MLYEVITDRLLFYPQPLSQARRAAIAALKLAHCSVITSYSIHYTKLYDSRRLERWFRPNIWYMLGMFVMVLLSVLNMYNASEFLYFNF